MDPIGTPLPVQPVLPLIPPPLHVRPGLQ
ncbi:hypothetical protein A2U01_0082726, partial [Trifolium medium]|nr:hypothetical protein [Trifolium medium]